MRSGPQLRDAAKMKLRAGFLAVRSSTLDVRFIAATIEDVPAAFQALVRSTQVLLSFGRQAALDPPTT
jgi:hypothetical protein